MVQWPVTSTSKRFAGARHSPYCQIHVESKGAEAAKVFLAPTDSAAIGSTASDACARAGRYTNEEAK